MQFGFQSALEDPRKAGARAETRRLYSQSYDSFNMINPSSSQPTVTATQFVAPFARPVHTPRPVPQRPVSRIPGKRDECPRALGEISLRIHGDSRRADPRWLVFGIVRAIRSVNAVSLD